MALVNMKNRQNSVKKTNSIISIELLNYEGPVLVAHSARKNKIFIITDEHKNIIEVFSYKKFAKFLNGDLDIVDSTGRRFNYLSATNDAKPNLFLLEYIKSLICE